MIWTNTHKKHSQTSEKTNTQEQILKFLYETIPGRLLLRPLITPAFSNIAGALLNSPLSALFIAPFARANHIDISDCVPKHYTSFNDFFTRELRKGARTICYDTQAFISPCDGKLSVYQIKKDSIFTIKDTPYTVGELLKNQALASQYEGGTIWIFRLGVEDYHRYIYPISGEKSRNYKIPGKLHTVNPLANDQYPIYKENSREFCLMKPTSGETMIMMEVGALMVGRIENRHPHTKKIARGKEKGNFAFGGSTIILITKKGTATPDKQFIENSMKHIETKIRLGQKVGTV